MMKSGAVLWYAVLHRLRQRSLSQKIPDRQVETRR